MNISILKEWNVIQERFLKIDDNMKLQIKLSLRKIVYPETTYLKPPSQQVKTKYAPNKVKPTSSDKGCSYFEHVYTLFLDSPTSKSQKKSAFKGVRISKPSLIPPLPKLKCIEEMSNFMHKYVK